MTKEELNVTVERPWGNYTSIEGGDLEGFKVKRIIVYPNQRLSLQSHKHRSEHWVITKGKGTAQLYTTNIELKKNDHFFISKGDIHRITNTGSENLEFIETQIGDYLGEDDILRYEDDYGRADK